MATSVRRQIVLRDDSSHTLRWVLPRLALVVSLCWVQLFRVGFHTPLLKPGWYTLLEFAGLAALAGIYAFAFIKRHDRVDWLYRRWREPFVLACAIGAQVFGLQRIFIAMLVFLFLILVTRIYSILTDRMTRPGLLFVSSFLILIACGTLMLKLPSAVPVDQPISWVDALFTSTSAVCVTGLIVRDTATQFTPLGQVIILVLIQLGGLGIMLFGSLFAVMFGGSISLRQASSIGEVVESSEFGLGSVDRLVRFVVATTFAVEALGAWLIYLFRPAELPLGAASGDHVFQSVFLSISAFCNAGFAPFTRSLVDYESRVTVHVLIALLIVLGGLGFPALYNLWQVAVARIKIRLNIATAAEVNARHLVRMNLHTKLVLVTSLALYVFGTVGLIVGQWSGFWHGHDPGHLGHIVANSSFMSVTARTAGFNSIEMTELAPASRYVLIILMYVGGSPGSTAGGIKTVVFAILALSFWSTIRGRRETEAFGRSIPFELIRRAGVAAMLGLCIVAGTTLLLTLTEPPGLEFDLFEATSACSTVGLSMGMTNTLSVAGRIVIVIAMFLGRVGPLVFIGVVAFGATRAARHARYRYPEETVVMG